MSQAPAAPSVAALAHHDEELRVKYLNWPIVVALAGVHLVALLAFIPALFTWSGLVLCLIFVWLTGGIGITLTFHRLLTHRSFKTYKWFEYFLVLVACLAWQGSPVEWVGMHRLHHKHSDGEEDPHSPQHGFTWAHVLWMLFVRVGAAKAEDAAKDLLRDPVMARINKYFWVPQLVLSAVLFGLGWLYGGPLVGLSWFVWAVAVRTVLVFHITWFVNSAAHTWGYQNYETTGEHSTNLWWVALLSFGEGWHNNHHAHPRSAAHGLRWYEFDITYQTIKLLKLVGLAWDIKMPEPHQLPDAQKAPSSGAGAEGGAGGAAGA